VYFRFTTRAPMALERAPLLEGLLARADPGELVVDWRAQAFRLLAPRGPMPPIAAAALRAVSDGGEGAWVCVATPVHLVAGMTGVRMPADAILVLDRADADALVADFNRVFSGGGMHLTHGRDNLLLCLFDKALSVTSTDPEEVLGEDPWPFLPAGADAAQLRRLMSEVEMWLHEHTVNQRRRARGVLPVSGLWLWGGGAPDSPVPRVHGWTAGGDPLFSAFAGVLQYPVPAGPGVVVVAGWPATAGWPEAEQRWLVPAVADLRAGRLKRIDLSLGKRCFRVSARGRWRFWRRRRPWWETFGVAAAAGVVDKRADER
jgi:hypothetical protein